MSGLLRSLSGGPPRPIHLPGRRFMEVIIIITITKISSSFGTASLGGT
jgi:hypothetical protein